MNELMQGISSEVEKWDYELNILAMKINLLEEISSCLSDNSCCLKVGALRRRLCKLEAEWIKLAVQRDILDRV